MLTKDLISQIAESTGMSKKDVEHMLNTHNAIVRETLTGGKAIQWQGLGTLDIQEKKERAIVHPRTGVRTVVPSRSQIQFHPVSSLKEELKRF